MDQDTTEYIPLTKRPLTHSDIGRIVRFNVTGEYQRGTLRAFTQNGFVFVSLFGVKKGKVSKIMVAIKNAQFVEHQREEFRG